MSPRAWKDLPAVLLALASTGALALALQAPSTLNRIPSSDRRETVDDFCNFPFEAVCQEQATNGRARMVQTYAPVDAAFRKALNAAVNWKSIPAADVEKIKTADAFFAYVSKLEDRKIATQIDAAFYTYYYLGTGAKIFQAEKQLEEALPGIVEDVRAAARASLKPEDFERASKNLDEVVLVTHENASRIYKDSPDGYQQYIANFRATCGQYLNRDNGISWFQTTTERNGFTFITKRNRFLLICPGTFLGTIEEPSGMNADTIINSVYQMVAHEIGHHIDSTMLGPGPFASYIDCLANEEGYSAQYDPVKEREITADFWAAKALANHLRDYYGNQPVSYSKHRLLRQALGWLCGFTSLPGIPNPAQSHPTGDYRISQIVRREPWIHEEMGCDDFYLPTSCTLEGPVKRQDESAR